MNFVLHKSFKKQFQKLPPKIQKKFFERADLFVINQFDPVLNNHAVDAAYPEWRSINITGDHRALYKNVGENLVQFMKIGTHSELYG